MRWSLLPLLPMAIHVKSDDPQDAVMVLNHQILGSFDERNVRERGVLVVSPSRWPRNEFGFRGWCFDRIGRCCGGGLFSGLICLFSPLFLN